MSREPGVPRGPAIANPSSAVSATVEEALIWEALRTVIDPEIGLDIVSLRLVYDVSVRDARASVRFTLTTPDCPMQTHLHRAVEQAVAAVPGVREVDAILVWDPRWHPGMILKDANP